MRFSGSLPLISLPFLEDTVNVAPFITEKDIGSSNLTSSTRVLNHTHKHIRLQFNVLCLLVVLCHTYVRSRENDENDENDSTKISLVSRIVPNRKHVPFTPKNVSVKYRDFNFA